jgi:hypothetical protein
LTLTCHSGANILFSLIRLDQLFHFLTEKPDVFASNHDSIDDKDDLSSVDAIEGDVAKSPKRKKKRSGSYVTSAL